MLLLSVDAYLGVVLPAVKSECPLAVSLTDTPSTRFTSTWGRAQDWKPLCDLYVVPGISTLRLWPWPRWGRNQWREPEGGGPASNVEASSFNSRASSVDLYVVLRISTPVYGRKPTTRTLRRVSDCSGTQCRPFRGPQDKYSFAVPWRLRREETNDTKLF